MSRSRYSSACSSLEACSAVAGFKCCWGLPTGTQRGLRANFVGNLRVKRYACALSLVCLRRFQVASGSVDSFADSKWDYKECTVVENAWLRCECCDANEACTACTAIRNASNNTSALLCVRERELGSALVGIERARDKISGCSRLLAAAQRFGTE